MSAPDIVDLKGRVAFVTGGGQGVGRAICLAMAQHGAGAVIVNDFHADRAADVAQEVERLGAKGVVAAGDITDYEGLKALVANAEAAAGPIDILVNNAGNAGPVSSVADLPPFWVAEPDEWDRWIDTNYLGVMYATRAVINGMIERGYGRIVTIISDAGRVGEPHLIVYSGAKAGAAGFMRGLAKGVARYGITANCVALGTIDTPGVRELIRTEEDEKKIVRHYPIRRFGQPEEVANTVLFLASDASAWITAQTWPVNGGYSVSV